LPEHVYIQVDGGIDSDTIRAAKAAGATLLVAGAAVFGQEDPASAYHALRQDIE
jgi:ribulose-phosphate 3-epimerase